MWRCHRLRVRSLIPLRGKNNIVIMPQGGNTSFMVARPQIKLETVFSAAAHEQNYERQKQMPMTVEAAGILENLQRAADESGLYFPLNLAAKGSCTIGGNLGTNAGGLNVVRYGTTRTHSRCRGCFDGWQDA